MSAIELRDVRLAYGSRSVLQGIDLTIASGERVALLGPNGAGKSTLLRCLVGSAPERRGAVLLDGVPIEEHSRESLARRVAVVPQQAVIPFSMRVEEVVALGRIPHEHPFRGPRAADRQAVARAIERVGLGHLVGRDARQLSMGERQSVLLAMAVAQSTGLLVLDEPTVHLDLRHRIEAMELLRTLNEDEGTTIVAVLHDLGLAAGFFPRVILMEHGRIVADGDPDSVLAPELVGRVFGVEPRLVRLFR